MEPKINLTALSPTYQQLYDLIGKDGMLLLHRELRGQQINFPMRLYDSKKLESIVQQEFNGHNLSALSKKYGYSQR